MKKLNEKGFGFFYWLLILLIMAALGWLGWYIWQLKNQQSAPQPESSQQNNSQPPAQTTYLVINEWGVRVKLTTTIADAYYLIKPDAPNYAYLSLKSLKNTDCAAEQTTLGVYTRYELTDTDELTGETYQQKGGEFLTNPMVGSKRFYYSQPQSYCSDNQAQDQGYWTQFKNAISSVEAVPAD